MSKEDPDCACSSCLGLTTSRKKTCEIARRRISKQKMKLSRQNYERKYSLNDILREELQNVE